MKLKIRLYRAHDIDLILLERCGAISIPDAARDALISYYTGRGDHPELTINSLPIGSTLDTIMPKTSLGKRKSYIVHHVAVSDKDAPGIETWIASMGKGALNCILKAALRIYLGVIPDRAIQELFGSIVKEPLEQKPARVDNKKKKTYPNKAAQPKAGPVDNTNIHPMEVMDEDLDPTSALLNLGG